MLKCEMSIAAEMAEGGKVALLWRDNEGEEERFIVAGGSEQNDNEDMDALASWLRDCFRRELGQLADRAAPKKEKEEEEKPASKEEKPPPVRPGRQPAR